MAKSETATRQRRLEVALLFLKLGLTAFGGPAAHVALMHNEVVTCRHWMDEQRFLDLFGAANMIPGPSSTELAIYLGYQYAGWIGLVLGGVCFILPAMLIVLVLAWAYVQFGTTAEAGRLFYGIKPVVIAIVAQALWNLSRKAVKNVLAGIVGSVVIGLYLLGVNVITLLVTGGGVMMLIEMIQRRKKGQALGALLPIAGLSLPAAMVSNKAFGSNVGGNLYDSSFTPGVMVNTILAGGSPKNCSGNTASVGYNLSDDASCGLTVTHDLSNTNPQLGPSQNNGGTTYSFMPAASSPAVNGGSNAYCPADDQRGVARPLASVCDIGAIESPYKLPQTITFAALPDRIYSDPPFIVTATASSGLTVSFTASGPCTTTGPNGHIITLLDGGTCTITAHQAGDATTAAAADVARPFTIVKYVINLPLVMRNY